MEEERGVQDVNPGAEEKKLPYSEWFYWLQTMVVAIICIVLVFTFLGRITRVVGHSMDPTLSDGELLLIWSLGYEPKAGDIVVCNKTTWETESLLHGDAIVKRVIAVAGQTVDIDYDLNTVFVDGLPLDEPYILEQMRLPGDPEMREPHFEVPENSVFLMGDNRNGSTDSRHARLGCVDTRYIMGKAVLALFPPSLIGSL